MPQVTGQVTSYDVMGKPRDLMGVIFEISPTDTPFLTMCKRTTATQTLHEWTTDELAPPAQNAQVDGSETTSFQGSTVTELNNRTQILRKAVQVSGTAQAIKEVGLSNQYRYQLAQRMKEIKKDLEFALLSNQVESAASKTTARLMRGLPCWFSSDHSLRGNGGAAATTSAPCTAGTQRALTEDMIKTIIRVVYEDGGNVDRLMAAPVIRTQMSTLLRSDGNRTDNIEKNKVRATVEVYVSDYGNVQLVPNRVQAVVNYSKNAIFALDPDFWACSFLRGFREEQLAKTGDSMKGHIIVEATLEARNSDSSGMIADILAA
jgi:hypothetical protein